jgi:hypothetical protein
LIPVTEYQVASHEVGCSAEYCEHRSSRRIGCLPPPRAYCFQRLGGSPSMPSPSPLRVRVHPLVSCTSPSEYVLQVTRPTQVPNTFQGLLPLRDKSIWSPQGDEISRSHLRFALSVSHALDDLLLQRPCGLISSHSHVRDSHFRGFPCCQANSPHRRAVPS